MKDQLTSTGHGTGSFGRALLKQADVLQGLYLFEDKFDTETIKRNFDFYEPMTVHESSLSACIHSIIGFKDR